MFLLHLYDGYSENFRLKEEVQLELNAVEACKNVRKTSKKFIILLMVKKIGQSCGVWEFLSKDVLPEGVIEISSKNYIRVELLKAKSLLTYMTKESRKDREEKRVSFQSWIMVDKNDKQV